MTLSASELAFKRIQFESGSRNIKMNFEKEGAWGFRATVPNIQKGERYPLVMALHWGGGGTAFEDLSKCLVEPAINHHNPFIISPDGGNNRWSIPENIDKVKTLVDYAKRFWPIDTSKIIVLGFSNGGNGSWHFAKHFPDQFSAAIPMASGYPIQEKIKMPVYVIHGEKDELFPVSKVEQTVTTARKLGTEIELSVIPKFTHYMACDYSNELKKGFDWVMNKLK